MLNPSQRCLSLTEENVPRKHFLFSQGLIAKLCVCVCVGPGGAGGGGGGAA